MCTVFSGYNRRDWMIACALVLALFFLTGMQITYGLSSWGDDFAAYISEGIAISTGTLQEQVVKNYTLHPAQLSAEATAEGLVYVWGYPLLLALVHKIVGFDVATFGSIIYYKIPSLIALSLTAGVAYLYYRRRFSRELAVLLTVVLCFCSHFVFAVEFLHVDILFLFVFQLSLLLADCYFPVCLNSDRPLPGMLLGIALGIAMWYTCETRLNGVTILIVVGLGHVIHLIQKRQKLTFPLAAVQILPYIVFAVLWFGSSLFLPSATSNLSDVGEVSPGIILYNIRYYLKHLVRYFNALIGDIHLPLWPLMFVLIAVGVVKKGFTAKNLPLTTLLIGSFIVLITLPYTQGLRYLYNILPVMLLFAATGGIHIWEWLCEKHSMKYMDTIMRSFGLLVLFLICFVQLKAGIHNVMNDRAVSANDVYAEESIELYHYVQENVPDDAMIGFCKPRAMYLNTQRMGCRLGYNGHTLEQVDYYLFCTYMNEPYDREVIAEQAEALRLIWSNPSFQLYEVIQ